MKVWRFDNTFDMCASSLGPTSPRPSARSSLTAARSTAAPTSAVIFRILQFNNDCHCQPHIFKNSKLFNENFLSNYNKQQYLLIDGYSIPCWISSSVIYEARLDTHTHTKKKEIILL